MRRAATTLTLIALIALANAGCEREPRTADSPPQAESERADWSGFTKRFIEEHFKAQPFFALYGDRKSVV